VMPVALGLALLMFFCDWSECSAIATAGQSSMQLCDRHNTPMEFKCPEGLQPDSLDGRTADPKGTLEGSDPKFRILACICPAVLNGNTNGCPEGNKFLFDGYFISCSSDPNSQSHRDQLATRFQQFQQQRVARVNGFLNQGRLKRSKLLLGEGAQAKMQERVSQNQIMTDVDTALRKAIAAARKDVCRGSIGRNARRRRTPVVKLAFNARGWGRRPRRGRAEKLGEASGNSAVQMASLISAITDEATPNYRDAWSEVSANVISFWKANMRAAGLTLQGAGAWVSGTQNVAQENGGSKAYQKLYFNVKKGNTVLTPRNSPTKVEYFLVRIDKDCNTPEFMLSAITMGSVPAFVAANPGLANTGFGGALVTTGTFTLMSSSAF